MSIFSNPMDAAAREAGGYTEAVLALVGDRDPVEILAELPDSLARLLSDLSDEQIRRPEKPGKWSVGQVVQHLADSELVWAWRLRSVAAQDGAPLTGYDQDRWASELGYADAPLEEALEVIRVVRAANLRLLGSLTAGQRRRSGLHSERGPESIDHMVGLYAGHDLVHRRQIERILGGF